jgi:LPS export ABC transporter protein LptC
VNAPHDRPVGGLLLLLLLPLLGACRQERLVRDDTVPPFVFRSLNLRQQDQKGQPAWELTSPEARYDIQRRVAQATSPKGVIYAKGKPIYRLEATSGTVLNDGEVILLEGAIRVQRLGRQPVLIKASRVRWMPALEMMQIDRHPEALDPHSRLVARRARFLLGKDQLELRGEPRLQRWTLPFDPFKGSPSSTPELELTVSRADWEPGTGLLEAEGPVLGKRRPPGASPTNPPQTLTASRLEGNTLEQEFRLRAPVRFDDPSESARFLAQDVRIDVAEKTIRTRDPFQANRGTFQVRGQSLEVYGKDDLVVIPAGCQLDRPGERLSADRCTWNWKTQDVQAEGSLQLHRATNRQHTRGHQLKGRLGDEGQLEVTAPGGRVFSEFQIPRRSGPPRRDPPPRREPEPIRL